MQKNLLASGVATAGVALGIGAAALTLGSATASATPSDTGSTSSSSSDSSSTKDKDSSSSTSAKAGPRSKPAKSDDDSGSGTDRSTPTRAAKKDGVADRAGSGSTKSKYPKDADTADAKSEKDVEDAEVDDPKGAEDTETDDTETQPVDDTSAELPTAQDPTATPVAAVKESLATRAKTAVVAERRSDLLKAEDLVSTPRPPSGPTLPDVPPSNPAEFFGWVGAQIQRTFFNRTPTIAPVQFVQTDYGQVVGSLGARDHEGDTLVYKLVTGPQRGTVVLHADGTFTYTPNASLIGEGGADSFSVEVSDIGPHLHLFNGSGTATATTVIGLRSDDDVNQNVGSTRGFNVYNLTSGALVYQGLSEGSVDSGPAVGAILQPGTNFHFEVVYHFFDNTFASPNFWSEDKNEMMAAFLEVQKVTGSSYVACLSSNCTPWDDWNFVDGNTVVFLDPPGTVIDIPAGDGQQQAQILNQLCGDSSQATCGFDVKTQETVYAPGKQVAPLVRNPTDYEQSMAHQVSETEGYSDSLGGSVKFGFKLTEIINMEINATYNHTWTTTHTYSDTITIKVPPWTEATLIGSAPMNRVHGDLTVKMGNTTWILRDVYFDSPNVQDKPTYTVQYTPIPHEDDETGRSEDIAIAL